MNKRIFTFLLSAVMALTSFSAYGAIYSDKSTGSVPSNLYVYEDFNSGSDYFYNKNKGINGKGLLFEWETQKPVGWFYGWNSAKRFSWLGSDSDGYFGYTGSSTADAGKNMSLLSNDYNKTQNANMNNRLKINNWETFKGSFVVSYDFLLPAQDNASYSNLVYLMHYANGTENKNYFAAQFPTMIVKSGAVYADAYQSEEWRTKAPTSIMPTSVKIIGAAPGDWVNVAMAVNRVPDSKRYSALCYVNGTLVSVCNIDPTIADTDNWASYERADVTEDSGFGLRISGRTADGEWLGIDNICYRVYSEGSNIESAVSVDSGATVVSVPVVNAELADTSAPAYAKQGIVDLEGVTITAKRYAAGDNFFTNATDETASFNYDKTNRQVTVPCDVTAGTPQPVTQAVGVDGTEIKVNIPSDLATGERLVLEFEGLKDITGKEIENNKVVVYTDDTTDAGILNVSGKDFFENDLEVDVTDNWDTSAKILKFETVDAADSNMQIYDGDALVSTAVFDKGVYTFTVADNSVLIGGKTYTVKKGGNAYATFTMADGTVRYGNISVGGGIVSLPYLNTTENSKTVDYIVFAKSNDGVVLDLVCEAKSLDAKKFASVSNTTALEYLSNAEAVVVDKLTYKDATEKSIAISATPFDTENKTTVSGNLGGTAVDKDVEIVVLKKDVIGENDATIQSSVVNAAQKKTDAYGNYSIDLNFTDMSTGNYIIEVYADSTVFKTEKLYGTESDNEDARQLLNGATSATEGETSVKYVLDNYSAALELDYEYYNKLDDNTDVAKYMYEYLSTEKDKGNNTPFATKQDASSIFRQATVAAAMNQGGIVTDLTDVDVNIDALNRMPASEWYSYKTDVDASRTDAWRNGLLSRFNSYAKGNYSNLDEFNKIIENCLVLEVVENPGTVSTLKVFMNDFAQTSGFNTDLITDKVLAKISGTDYQGCTLTKLKEGMISANQSNQYDENNTYNPGGGGGGGGGFSGGKVSISSDLVNEDAKEPIGSVEPAVTYTFDDVAETPWASVAIEALVNEGIISGKEDGLFHPNDNITREEFTKLIVALFELKTDDTEFGFDDVATDDWSYEYIKAAYQNKIISGIGNGLFGYGRDITRQDAAVIIYNTLISTDYMPEASDGAKFADEELFADYAAEAIKILSGMKVINGYTDGSFGPNGSLTRAEAAKLIYGLVGYVGI